MLASLAWNFNNGENVGVTYCVRWLQKFNGENVGVTDTVSVGFRTSMVRMMV